MTRIERLRRNEVVRGLEKREALALVGAASKADPPVIATAWRDPEADDGTYAVYPTGSRSWAR